MNDLSDSLPPASVVRIIDAAINRAGEGLRVVEDYLRMVMSDAHLAGQVKQMRHDLTEAIGVIDLSLRMATRDSEHDVGRHLQTTAEYHRPAPGEASVSGGPGEPLLQANFSRVQQSLRSIEEYSKSFHVGLAKQVEQLRYRTYTLEKAILTTVLSLRMLKHSHVCVLVSSSAADHRSTGTHDFSSLLQHVEELVAAEVGMIQLRDKHLTDRELVTVGKQIAARTRGSKSRFIMNDRADLAVATHADGVHLGQDDLQIADARQIVGAARLIGVSTHSLGQARAAVIAGANYIGVGPVFPSTTKSFTTLAGLELLREVSAEIQLPAFAIGGISSANIQQVRDAGFRHVAVAAAGKSNSELQELQRILLEP